MKDISLKELNEGEFYHICTNGTECPVLLKDDKDYIAAWNLLAITSWRHRIKLMAFCIMSNHLHIIANCIQRDEAISYIRHIKQKLSAYLLNRYGISASLKGTKDCISKIEDIRYLRNCVAYVLRNPVCAKTCARVDDYRWSSYRCLFRSGSEESVRRLSELTETEKRKILKTRISLKDCPLTIDADGIITAETFVHTELTEAAFANSGKSFLFHLGRCNDARMEYEFQHQPLMRISDIELVEKVEDISKERFQGKGIAELKTSQKCSLVKTVFFCCRTSIPQTSRILGLPREIVRKILCT